MLERHWSKPQPGIGDDGQPIRTWIETDQTATSKSLATEDETGRSASCRDG